MTDQPTNQQADADRWNTRYPIGTPVTAYPGTRPADDPHAELIITRTRSEAQVLEGHTAVVWVDGHSSCIALTHVDPIQSADTYVPPAKYLRSDNVDCCPHAVPVEPGSCEACWDLVKWDAVDSLIAPAPAPEAAGTPVAEPAVTAPPAELDLDEYESAARNAARIGSGIDPAAVLELAAEVRRLRAELERRTEDLAFLERTTLPELRREVEHHEAGKRRWRGRAEGAEAELAGFRAKTLTEAADKLDRIGHAAAAWILRDDAARPAVPAVETGR